MPRVPLPRRRAFNSRFIFSAYTFPLARGEGPGEPLPPGFYKHKAFDWPEEIEAKKRKQEILRKLGYIPKTAGQPKKELSTKETIRTPDIANSFGINKAQFYRDIELARAVEKEPGLKKEPNKTMQEEIQKVGGDDYFAARAVCACCPRRRASFSP